MTIGSGTSILALLNPVTRYRQVLLTRLNISLPMLTLFLVVRVPASVVGIVTSSNSATTTHCTPPTTSPPLQPEPCPKKKEKMGPEH